MDSSPFFVILGATEPQGVPWAQQAPCEGGEPPKALSVLHQELDRLLHRRSRSSEPRPVSRALAPASSPNRANSASLPPEEAQVSEAIQDGKQVLPRASPYVGFKRHAPPSPKLCFQAAPPSAAFLPLPAGDDLGDFRLVSCAASEAWSRQQSPSTSEVEGKVTATPGSREGAALPGLLPEEVWVKVLSSAVEVPSLAVLMRIARCFPAMLRSEAVWNNRLVRLPPGVVGSLAPHLKRWAYIWHGASKLVLPRSSQLFAEVRRLLPAMPIEVAWRFDTHLKGEGVEVLSHGNTVRRTADDELVVLGDAPLHRDPGGRPPYVEVRLDQRGAPVAGDTINDFGFGVTACHPDEIHNLGSVADEVPQSWVVDFTETSIVLSVDNHEAGKSRRVTSADLREGSRVGLRIFPNAVEVYIDGHCREELKARPQNCIPATADLFPVLDLYGRTIQVTRTDADCPES